MWLSADSGLTSLKDEMPDCGLCCVKEKVLLEAMYEVPGSDIVSVIVTQDAVAEGKQVDYVRKPRFLSSH